MSYLTRMEKLGKGAYGTVYSARDATNNNLLVAVKRNLIDAEASGIGVLRELDMLARLKGHPFIIDLISVSFCDPFKNNPMSPVLEICKMKEDKVHFIMERAHIACDTLFKDKKLYCPYLGKILLTEILLAVEYFHALGITHRDLKPANILMVKDATGRMVVKICDFGMSQTLCNGHPSTPGVTTSWYRAPEICCGIDSYNNASDMWSVGCIVFEIFGKYPFLNGLDTEKGESVFNEILNRLPYVANKNIVNNLKTIGTGNWSNTTYKINKPIKRWTFIEQMKMTPQYKEEFEKTTGSMTHLTEILNGLLNLNPIERWSAKATLKHPFFNDIREYIESIQRTFPPIPPALPIIVISNSIERQWMIALAFSIYNNKDNISWYCHRTLFHAIDLFDRYLEWAFKDDNAILEDTQTIECGRLHNRMDTELRFYACLYIFYKYNTTMHQQMSWKEFVPELFSSFDAEIIYEEFEVIIDFNLCDYTIYRDTLFEIGDAFNIEVSEDIVKHLLSEYGKIEEWKDGSVRALYRKFMHLDKNGRQIR
jgi:serine/threonine protein kinase